METDFRTRLVRTLRAVEAVLREPGVMVAGSEVPNLLEPDAASTLVVSQDVDIAVPIERHGAVKARLREIRGLARSADEPSVWLPQTGGLLEVNFIGVDATSERSGETYVLDDDELPLLVFAQLSLLRPGRVVSVDGIAVPLPHPAGLLLEKLVTDRSGEKGDRDLLVALALILVAEPEELRELRAMYLELSPELRYAARSGLSTLSLLEPRLWMPDPTRHRRQIGELAALLDERDAPA